IFRDWQINEADVEAALATSLGGDPTCPVFLAAEGDRVVGLMGFVPSERTVVGARGRGGVYLHGAVVHEGSRGHGIGVALLAHGCAWARQQGFQRCSVSWSSANLISDRFWRGRGFQPLTYSLLRMVPSRSSRGA